MSPRPRIGWYVHHHGNGHLTRFLAVRPHLDAEVTVFSSLAPPEPLPDRTEWVRLAPDAAVEEGPGGALLDPREQDPEARGALHWAPLGHRGHRERLAEIARVAHAEFLDAFVVDVSVEVALFVRLLGVPVVVVSQPGERTDAPHRLAYRVADRILAPWDREAVPSAALDAAAAPVLWSGGISRFDGRERPAAPEERTALVLGRTMPPEEEHLRIAEAARGGWRLRFAGSSPSTWDPDPWRSITGSAVVVSASGQNSVADLAAAGARVVLIPQERPFAEQRAMGEAVRAAVDAVVLDEWPADGELVATLERAAATAPDWSVWRTEGAAARAARIIAGAVRGGAGPGAPGESSAVDPEGTGR